MEGARNTTVLDQLLGIITEQRNSLRHSLEESAIRAQALALARALKEMAKFEQFISGTSRILGSGKSKHGEIAEAFEVYYRNASSFVNGGESVATFDNVGRTSPVDFILHGRDMQAKWYNGVRNGLTAIAEHLQKYPWFTNSGGRYIIPRDQYDALISALAGESSDHFSDKTISTLVEKVRALEAETGLPFDKLFVAGSSDYAQVQQGKVFALHDEKVEEIRHANSDRLDDIYQEHAPSLGEAAKVAASAAAFAALMRVAIILYRKNRAGKNVFRGDMTAEDWKEVFGEAGFAALEGGLTGGALYYLTNFAGMSAPLASAVLTATKGVASLGVDYQNGKISLDDFTSLGLIVCSEAGVVGLAAFAGQAFIPVPVLGAFLGVMSGRFLVSIAKTMSDELAKNVQARLNDCRLLMDEETMKLIAHLDARLNSLGDLTATAFSVEYNDRLFNTSVALARAYKVSNESILASESDLDRFMLDLT